jgi:hypothetical protein
MTAGSGSPSGGFGHNSKARNTLKNMSKERGLCERSVREASNCEHDGATSDSL